MPRKQYKTSRRTRRTRRRKINGRGLWDWGSKAMAWVKKHSPFIRKVYHNPVFRSASRSIGNRFAPGMVDKAFKVGDTLGLGRRRTIRYKKKALRRGRGVANY